MTVRTFRGEFPDFDPATMPAIPDGWQDVSWHNDACPSWIAKGDDDSGLTVYIDHAKPARRDMDMGARYLVQHHAKDADLTDVFLSDVWADVLRVVEHWEAGQHCTLIQWAASGVDCMDLGQALQELTLMGEPGRLYGQGCLYVMPLAREWFTVIENAQPQGDLRTVEAALYSWALSAGYCGLLEQLAYNYCRGVREYIGPDKWARLITDADASPADFMDDNITMQETLEAFGIAVFDSAGEHMRDEALTIWNATWERAKPYLGGALRLVIGEGQGFPISPPLETDQPRENRFRAALERAEAILAASDEGDREHAQALRAILDQTGTGCFEPNCPALTDLISVAIDG